MASYYSHVQLHNSTTRAGADVWGGSGGGRWVLAQLHGAVCPCFMIALTGLSQDP